MKLVSTVEEMKKAENAAIEMSIPGIVLMENAALGVIKHTCGAKSVRVFCGKGNNAGDGFCIARHLYNKGVDVEVILVSEPEFRGDALTNYNAIVNMGVKITPFSQIYPKSVDLIIDAIFGTGLNQDVRGVYKEAIDYINSQPCPKIAVDIPSGISADSGEILGCAVKADKTITFGMYKYAHFLYDAKYYCGKVYLEDIQIPESATENIKTYIFDQKDAANLLPARKENSHKGTFGRLLVIGGSNNMPGAPLLCANASLRSGCGITVLALPHSAAKKVSPSELILLPLPEDGGAISYDAIGGLQNELKNSNAVAIGCGMGQSEGAYKVLEYILNNYENPILIDADGLNVLAKNLGLLKRAKSKNIVLTPHPKEFSRLSGLSADEILKNPYKCAREFSSAYNVNVILKGAHSAITTKDGTTYISPFATSALSKAGSGDVLSGIISSLLAQGLSPEHACLLGVTIHGLCGVLAQMDYSAYSVIATDLINFIPKAIKQLQNQGVN